MGDHLKARTITNLTGKLLYISDKMEGLTMPFTLKGKKIMEAMRKTYPTEEKAKEVFYASENKGVIKGVHPKGSRSVHKKARK